jgi:hypothetical protein
MLGAERPCLLLGEEGPNGLGGVPEGGVAGIDHRMRDHETAVAPPVPALVIAVTSR